jgi:hypothetical protein
MLSRVRPRSTEAPIQRLLVSNLNEQLPSIMKGLKKTFVSRSKARVLFLWARY